MKTASGNKKSTYWERVRFDGSAQSSMYVVVNKGRLIMATTSLNLARQTFAKVRQGLDIEGLVGEKVQTSSEVTQPTSESNKSTEVEQAA
jgi:hypothetical protein